MKKGVRGMKKGVRCQILTNREEVWAGINLPEKRFIAREIKRDTTFFAKLTRWLAENLHMKSPANVSEQIKSLSRNEILRTSNIKN